ncbi:Melibiase-domain-containing protein [Gilbertella persicaria]|uniref:Melibiase-domain-containing protein n=1 Tax=Gilbertella persicaria TaxID=101096 RepID=UPI00221EA93D|nr:Melibiase-domain-containing protein [Gilbertella persicaria]KAI8058926.1 Melibiase-domain-containing protein [Gilbertella persicaria]
MQLLKPEITPHQSEPVWFLTTQNTTYVVGVDKETGVVLNAYWGPRLMFFTDIEYPIKLPETGRSSQDPAITSANEEYPAFGGLRYGPDVLRVKFENNTRELDLIYVSGEVRNHLELVITLVDRTHKDFRVELNYTIDIDNDLILRRATLVAYGHSEKFQVTKAHTAAWYIPPITSSCHRELVTLAGAWSCETQVQKHTLKPGTSHVLGSTRGIPSHQAYPWFAVKDQDDGEHANTQVYFGTLGWSGNWQIELHTDIEGRLVVTGGLHDHDFSCSLKDTTLELPTFVAGYTAEGLSGARRSLANHIRTNKSREFIKDPKALAPVLYNGWEAYGFDTNLKNQIEMATKAAAMGAELFVLDDGWFHKRNSDRAGLGDWFADHDKFPEGLKPLADHVHKLGMKFGVWFEPEMVNPDSNLYRDHPDWVYHYPDRIRHLERNQLVLNITKEEVRTHLIERIVSLVQEVGIDYIKWDMNRPISEAGSSLGEAVWIAHVNCFHLMIMKIKLSTNLVAIETCSSGGGRADLSILKKVESCWPSDNTRPDARLHIQYGSSFVIPSDSMSCWVTDMPLDDPYALFPISYRFHVSFMGALGIGSFLNRLDQQQFEEYKHWIALYKVLRHVLQKGNLDWLVPPSNSPSSYTAVTQTNTATGNESVVLAFRQQSPFWIPLHPVRLKRLIAFAMYDVTIWHESPLCSVYNGALSGAALMHKGLDLPYLTSKAYSSVVIHIKQKL